MGEYVKIRHKCDFSDKKLGTKKIIVWMALPRRMTLWFFFALEFHNTSVEIMGGAEGTM